MSLLGRLLGNKGTVSSELGKTLANQALAGDGKILSECIEYSAYKVDDPSMKSVRSGAAKAVELVAEKKPHLVQKHLERLLPALEAKEPQTRWMVIRIMGYCVRGNPDVAKKAIPFAQKILEEKEGLCIASSADLFLGDYGSIAKSNAKRIFPLLEKSIRTCIPNEQDWILEALFKLYPVLGKTEKEKSRRFANQWRESPRKSTQARAKTILELEM
jgi:hypothetical protein